MDLLSSHRAPAPAVSDKPRKGVWLVEIRDEKTKQSLLVEHDEPVEAYVFLDPEVSARARRSAPRWQPGERHADGLLIGELDGEVWVCFEHGPAFASSSMQPACFQCTYPGSLSGGDDRE